MRPRDSATARAAEPRARAQGDGTPRWWGTFTLAEGEAAAWRLGPLALGIEHRAAEWRAGWSRETASSSAAADGLPTADVHAPIAAVDLPATTDLARFATAAAESRLRVEPVLPDRAVVARPEQPFALLPGEQVALHVAVPVWVRLALADGTSLVDVPTERLRQTWLGTTTAIGELCWVTPVPVRLVRERLPASPHLAQVEVTLTNRAEAPLLVERVSVPVIHLALWWHAERGLVTNAVAVERDADGSMARLRIAETMPLAGAEPVVPARQPEPRLGLVRALESWLG